MSANIFVSMFLVLIQDYTLCFTGSPYCIFSYCKFSYYNYISIWPYYIVIHLCMHNKFIFKWSCTLTGSLAREAIFQKTTTYTAILMLTPPVTVSVVICDKHFCGSTVLDFLQIQLFTSHKLTFRQNENGSWKWINSEFCHHPTSYLVRLCE